MSTHNLYATYGCWHLRFLLDFFTATGLTPYSFSQLTDNPRSAAQALRMQLKKDDMKLSRAKQIVSIAGYKLDVEFNDKASATKETPGYSLILPDDLRENLERGVLKNGSQYKNLTFLKKFLSRNNLSYRKLAQKIGMSVGAVETWFCIDDMAISYLYRIKDAFQADISFIVSEKESARSGPHSLCRLTEKAVDHPGM